MPKDIRKAVEVTIDTGMLDVFTQIVAQFIDKANTEDGTLSYECFLNADESRCFVPKWYRDSEALLTHPENVRELY